MEPLPPESSTPVAIAEEPPPDGGPADAAWTGWVTWGAAGLAVIAAAALLVVTFAGISRSGADAPQAQARSSTTDAATAFSADPSPEEVNPPLTAPMEIRSPSVWGPARYRQGGEVAIVDLSMTTCGRTDLGFGAMGTIENLSPMGQTFDYTIEVELVRALTGQVLETFEIPIEGIRPGGSSEWTAEVRSDQVIKVRCHVRSLLVAPRT